MKRKLDLNIIEKWAYEVGGVDEAARLISKELECSLSKGMKLARGQYDSTPAPLEQVALAGLINVSRDQLFPLLAQGKGRSRKTA